MSDTKEFDRLARLIWPDVSGIDVETDVEPNSLAIEIGDEKTLLMCAEINHPKAREGMVALLRVMAGEAPPALTERERRHVEAITQRIRDNGEAVAECRYNDVQPIQADEVAELLVVIHRLRATAADATERASHLPGMSAELDATRFAVKKARELVAKWRAESAKYEPSAVELIAGAVGCMKTCADELEAMLNKAEGL